MYNDVGTTHLRDGCFVCPMDKDGNRPKLVVKGAFIVCSQCGAGFADATPENIDHLRSTPHDWVEDFQQENGLYLCACSLCDKTFTGHKRRVVCKLCATLANRGLVRYCYECGTIGEVSPGKRDCCPDGSHATRVPLQLAEQARLGFLAAGKIPKD